MSLIVVRTAIGSLVQDDFKDVNSNLLKSLNNLNSQSSSHLAVQSKQSKYLKHHSASFTITPENNSEEKIAEAEVQDKVQDIKPSLAPLLAQSVVKNPPPLSRDFSLLSARIKPVNFLQIRTQVAAAKNENLAEPSNTLKKNWWCFC